MLKTLLRKNTKVGFLALMLLVTINYFFPDKIPALINIINGSSSKEAPYVENEKDSQNNRVSQADFSKLVDAVREQRSKVWIKELPFKVVKLLKDDNKGSRHQRFLVTADSLPTLLVAHNIDLAERVPLAAGDIVLVKGRYEWNNKGGVLHWTHHDPKNNIQGGWLRFKGKLYR